MLKPVQERAPYHQPAGAPPAEEAVNGSRLVGSWDAGSPGPFFPAVSGSAEGWCPGCGWVLSSGQAVLRFVWRRVHALLWVGAPWECFYLDLEDWEAVLAWA